MGTGLKKRFTRHQCLSAVGPVRTRREGCAAAVREVRVTNAFRLWVLFGHGGGEKGAQMVVGESPVPFGCGCYSDDENDSLGKVLDYGVTNAFRLWLRFGPPAWNRMGVRSVSRHQCLSAVGPVRTWVRRLMELVKKARSPVPFGCGSCSD